MKKVVFFLSIFSIVSCKSIFGVGNYSYYSETHDDFKDVNRISFEERLLPAEKHSSINGVYNYYLREENTFGLLSITLYVNLIKNQVDFFTEDECYIATDSEVFKKKITSKEIEHFSTISESTSNILKADSTTVSVIDSYSQNNYVQSRFKIQFTPKEIHTILQSDKLVFRYYGGGKTSTFSLSETNLKQVKRVLGG